MAKKKGTHGPGSELAEQAAVKVVILATNAAVVSPPAGQLALPIEYREYFTPVNGPDEGQAGDGPPLAEFGPCSVLPAGLVQRLRADLEEAGYRVEVEDRRRFEQGFRVSKRLFEAAWGEDQELLRAARREPLGQVDFSSGADLDRRLAYLCRLYPEARTLIAADGSYGAMVLHGELINKLGEPVGLLAKDSSGMESRCLVSTSSWLPRLRPGSWDVLLPVLMRSSDVSEANFRAVVRLQARRVYGLVGCRDSLGRRRLLRLEAMCGPRLCLGGD